MLVKLIKAQHGQTRPNCKKNRKETASNWPSGHWQLNGASGEMPIIFQKFNKKIY